MEGMKPEMWLSCMILEVSAIYSSKMSIKINYNKNKRKTNQSPSSKSLFHSQTNLQIISALLLVSFTYMVVSWVKLPIESGREPVREFRDTSLRVGKRS